MQRCLLDIAGPLHAQLTTTVITDTWYVSQHPRAGEELGAPIPLELLKVDGFSGENRQGMASGWSNTFQWVVKRRGQHRLDSKHFGKRERRTPSWEEDGSGKSKEKLGINVIKI